MILAFTEVFLLLVGNLDPEEVEIFTGVLVNSVECSAVRLLHAAVFKQLCIIGTYLYDI